LADPEDGKGVEVAEGEATTYGAIPQWSPGNPKVRSRRVLLQWLVSAAALYIAALIMREFKAPWVRVSVAKLAALKSVKRLGVTIERGARS